MPEDRKPQSADKYIVRFPAGMRDRIAEAAKANNRSMNAEIVARLQATFDETVVTTVEARVKHGAEEKRFEFNADEIADKVVQRLEGWENGLKNKVILRRGAPVAPFSTDSLLDLYARLGRMLEPEALAPRDNTPHGPQKSSNAKRPPPKSSK